MTASDHPVDRAFRQDWRPVPARLIRAREGWRARVRLIMRRTWGRAQNSVVLWQGTSEYDERPIAIVATGFTATQPAQFNAKTGPLLQLYILPLHTHPHEATRTGGDMSVCGQCPQRPVTGGKCYVTTQWAPSRLWGAMAGMPRCTHREDAAFLLAGAQVRFGAWGDPAAVPLDVWLPLVKDCASVVSYTHDWMRLHDERWQQFCMASVDSIDERAIAKGRGWRTFRVDWENIGLLPGERWCPAHEHRVTCMACRGCGGQLGAGRPDYVIVPHGARVDGRRGGQPPR